MTSNTTTTTKERPILFSGPMVRAILDGRKTQTRRVIKMRNGQLMGEGELSSDGRTVMDFSRSFPYWKALPCPYGKPGDRLWVRETWAAPMTILGAINYWAIRGDCRNPPEPVVYRADTDTVPHGGYWRWRGGTYMPRWASRLTLRITDVRVERVQDISDYDCHCEGIALTSDDGENYREDFAVLWDAMHGRRGYGWDVNPWVWVIDFEVMQHG